MAGPNPIKAAREQVEAYNVGDWRRLKAAFAPGAIYNEIGTQRRMRGASRIVQAYQEWKLAIPDSRGTIISSLARGNVVVQEIVWKGTHTGTLEGPAGPIRPSGKPISVPSVQIVTVQNGKIKTIRHYFNLLTLLQEIGAAAAVVEPSHPS